MVRSSFTFIAVAWLASLAACSGCDPKKEDTGGGGTCGQNGAVCAAAGDCCSGYCNGSNQCATAPTCGATNATCNVDPDCCTGLTCQLQSGSKKCATPPACRALNQPCVDATDCCAADGLTCGAGGTCQLASTCVADGAVCSGTGKACCAGEICDLYSATPTNTCSKTACIEDGRTCNAAEPCCSGACDTTTGKCPTNTGTCRQPGAGCTTGSQCCSGTCDTRTATCSNAACIQTPEPCSLPSQCCSGYGSCSDVSSGVCEVVPPGTVANDTCKTLGESCTTGADCCSTNCKSGTCVSAYTCNASGDICYKGADCCSGTCDLSNPASLAGRCVRPNGGCVQDGNPCSGNSGCCTRLCADPGSGVTVCMPAGGCRMTGDFCDSTGACCGAYPDTMDPGGYGIECKSSVSDPTPRCSNGQSCNPPGNICGVSKDVNASQNCCMPPSYGGGSGKAACKQDDGGIWRCYGGPAVCHNPDGSVGNCTTLCPTGFDPNKPECCLDVGQVCEFGSQCCNGTPCTQDATGVYRCTPANDACLPGGASCTAGGGGTPCCDPNSCIYLPEFGNVCAQEGPTGCTPTGSSTTCSTDDECCQKICDPTSHCALCRPQGDACTQGSECCGGICDMGICRDPVCLPAGSDCTGAESSCCSGYSCIQTAEFGKVCTIQPGGGGCASLNATCGASGCCTGFCTLDPADSTAPIGTICRTCKSDNDTCTAGTQCCTGYCDPGTNKCAPQCVPSGGGCTNTGDCCTGSTCVIPGGASTGTCEAADFCKSVGGGCLVNTDCCGYGSPGALACDTGTYTCQYPVTTCSNSGGGCGVGASDTKCCTGQNLTCQTLNGSGSTVACTGTTADTVPCTCNTPCANEGSACDANMPCCIPTSGSLSCVSGTCQQPVTCATPVGVKCSLTQPCCATDGTYCADPTKAPCNAASDAAGTCTCQNPG